MKTITWKAPNVYPMSTSQKKMIYSLVGSFALAVLRYVDINVICHSGLPEVPAHSGSQKGMEDEMHDYVFV